MLVRSLAEPPAWPGMRLPQARPRARETSEGAALAAVCEQCDIEPEELHFNRDVPPVVYYSHLPSGEVQVVTLYVAFATFPPPADGYQDDESGEEDEDDLYDWFTFEQALAALATDAEREALRMVPCCLLPVALPRFLYIDTYVRYCIFLRMVPCCLCCVPSEYAVAALVYTRACRCLHARPCGRGLPQCPFFCAPSTFFCAPRAASMSAACFFVYAWEHVYVCTCGPYVSVFSRCLVERLAAGVGQCVLARARASACMPMRMLMSGFN